MELIVRSRDDSGVCSDKIYQYHEIDSLASNSSRPKRTRELVFVTGNENKVKELEDFIKPKLAKLTVLDLDLTEIQSSDILDIVEDKCRRAFQQVRRQREDLSDNTCLMIEDSGLHFKAFNGLPGPYIKCFLEKLKPIGLYKMLEGFEDKSAEATCTYALMENESRIVFCRGTVRGRITSPRGNSWGWDPIFEEERTGNTFGEMDAETKSKFSHRANAIIVLRKYLSVVD